MLVEEREGVGGGFGEVEDSAGEDAEIQGADGGDQERYTEGGGDGCGRVVLGGFVEIHGDYYSQ